MRLCLPRLVSLEYIPKYILSMAVDYGEIDVFSNTCQQSLESGMVVEIFLLTLVS